MPIRTAGIVSIVFSCESPIYLKIYLICDIVISYEYLRFRRKRQYLILSHETKKKKRFVLKLHENTFFKKIGTERLKLLAVLLFFLFSGIWYSHSFATGALEMGTPASAEKITEKREINAENDADRLNINTATAKELMRLSGIGEKKAAEIVAYREENGGFSDIAELMRVSGIGEKTFAEIKDEITVGE